VAGIRAGRNQSALPARKDIDREALVLAELEIAKND